MEAGEFGEEEQIGLTHSVTTVGETEMFEENEGFEEEEMRVGDVVAVGEAETLQAFVVGDVGKCFVRDVGLVKDESLQGREEVKVGARDCGA